MRRLATLLILMLAMPWYPIAMASHSYGGLDLCTLYPEVMPPGLEVALLPEPASQGARLLQTYCGQCHALPGPGRHTAREWPAVLARMTALMQASSRFSGFMGHVRAPTVEEGDILRAYLVEQALRPLVEQPRGLGARAFVKQCSACHALPDPAQHSPAAWPAVIRRMQRHMVTMQRQSPSREVILQVQTYVQQASAQGMPMAPEDRRPKDAAQDARPDLRTTGLARLDAWLALGPFFGLTLLGVVRWRRGRS